MLPALLVISGASALAYEVLWARDWALVYGGNAPGAAVVLAAYFTGLALGALLGQRLARGGTLWRTFAALELGVAATVGVYLMLRPLLCTLGDAVTLHAPRALLPVARALLAFAILGPTTVLLGATLPVVATADAVALYAWNTLGGAAGALGATILVPLIGMRGTYLVAMAADCLVGVVAWRRSAASAPVHAATRPPSGRTAAVLLAACAGFVGLAAEVLWMRGLSGVTSSSPYSVAIVLAIVLVGLVVGAWTARNVIRRGVAPATVIATASGVVVAAAVGAPVVLRALPSWSLALIREFGAGPRLTGFAIEATLATMIVGPGAAALGTLLPATVLLDGEATLGRLLASNTAGGVAGSLATAFVLLPRLGIAGAFQALAAVALLPAVWAASGYRRGLAAVALLMAVAAIPLVPPLTLPWRGAESEHVLFSRDGPTASVLVTADPEGRKLLRVDGQYSLGGTKGLLLEQREAHLPLLLHPAPRRLLHLGLGTGDTLGAAMLHPGLHALGIELIADVLDAARLFERENRRVLAHPQVRLLAMDARAALRDTSATYDVIVADLVHPWTAGAGALFTREHYALARDRLAPGGVFCHWLPLHQLPTAALPEVVATALATFPHVQLWLAYHRATTVLAAVVGSSVALRPDASALRARMAEPTLASGLADVGLDDPGDLAVLYVAADADLARAVGAVAPLTDDRPTLEFAASAAYFARDPLPRAGLAWLKDILSDDDGPITGAPAPKALRATLADAQLALLDGNAGAEAAAYLRALAIAPSLATIRQPLTAIASDRRRRGDLRSADLIENELSRER